MLIRFFPRDAVLARVLAMALCLFVSVCVCLSQDGVLSNGINGFDLVFGTGASFDHSYTVFKGNSGTTKIRMELF